MTGKPARLRIPPLTQNGQVFRLKGYGMPVDRQARGDRATCTPASRRQLPTQLSAEEREHYEALAKLAERGKEAQRRVKTTERMNLNKFTEKAQEAVITAQNLADRVQPLRDRARASAGGAGRAVRRNRAVHPAEAGRSTRRASRPRRAALLDVYSPGLRRGCALLAADEADLRLRAGRGRSVCRTSSSAPSTCSSRSRPRPAAPPPHSCSSALGRPRTPCMRR